MNEKTTSLVSRFLAKLLFALPVLSLVLAAMAWLRYGFDLPWFDDWRGYLDGNIHSLDLAYLFRAVNDTLAPVGFALDALAQRHLDGNSVAYQLLSMVVVLGGLLLLQWKLLLRLLGDKLHASVCFSTTVLMLQPGSYWGWENMAYHQGLPLVFILGALSLIATGAASRWRGPAMAALALLAGFTYISGAFAALAVGLTLIVVICLTAADGERHALLRDAFWFTAGALVAVGAQFLLSILTFRGTHAGVPMALPTQLAFWAFYLGKLGRSLLLPPEWPWPALALTLAAVLAAASTAWLVLRRAMAGEGTDTYRRMARLYIPLAGGIFAYLMMVAAGRANYRPDGMTQLIDIYAFGFTRFHFFWATLLWPWVTAAAILLCRTRSWGGSRRFDLAVGSTALALAALIIAGGGWSHMAEQKHVASIRLPVARCLLEELQRGGDVRCWGLIPGRYNDVQPNAYPAYVYAKKMNASFVRYFPLVTGGKRRDSITPFFRFDGKSAKPLMHDLEALGGGAFRATGPDPQLHLQTQQPQVTRNCSTMDVDVEIRVPQKDTVQLFYVPAGDSEVYAEKHAFSAPVGDDPASFQMISFRMESDSGFFESVRLDPVTSRQTFDIREIRIYCVRERG